MATISPDYDLPQSGLDNTQDDPRHRAPLVTGRNTLTTVTAKVADLAAGAPTLWWWAMFVPSFALMVLFFTSIGYMIASGVGVLGNNHPVMWGWPIINFVFWVGIGHAGTLISAILFLFRQDWRTGINRFAEAMTIFAVCCAGIFPAIHVGRPWLAYWLFPYPNQMAMWPQFRSPLLWDVFAVSTYATVSVLFWYTGMVPDIATLRDRARNRIAQVAYGILSLGWNGSSRHWHRFERAYLLLAALATPLVLSVHSVVSFDFAVSQVPGWHTTFFPPYFVAGAIYGGFAMVLCLAVPARNLLGIKELITERHIENCCKVMLGVGWIVTWAYAMEFFIAWYSQHHFELWHFLYNRAFGPMAWGFWTLIITNCLIPQILWYKPFRTWWPTVLLCAISINIGMWFERFVIVVISLHRDFLPSAWGYFEASLVDWAMLIGSFGLFFTLFLLFCKFLPVVAIAEVKTVMPQAHPGHHHGEHEGPEAFSNDYRVADGDDRPDTPERH